jgi:hypothetical protein
MIADTTSRLLAAALADARTQLATAEVTNLDDDLAVIKSHAGLTVALRRVLWVLNAEDDDTTDIAAQVAGEDGVRSIGIPKPRRNTESVAA